MLEIILKCNSKIESPLIPNVERVSASFNRGLLANLIIWLAGWIPVSLKTLYLNIDK